MNHLKSLILASILTVPFAASAQVAFTNQSSPNGNQPLAMPAWYVVSLGADITVTISPFDFNGGPSFNGNTLYAGTSLGSLMKVGTNYQFGTSVDLGTIAAGQEIIVAMTSQQGYTYYTGENAGLNADGYNHADLYNSAGGAVVDFEDLSGIGGIGNSDWNYGDAKVVVSGAQAQAVPEPLPCAALGLGLMGLVIRRKRK